MYLRKWSPIKFLMYLWLTILIWIFCWCQSAHTMHLTPYNSHNNVTTTTTTITTTTSSLSSSSSSSSSLSQPAYHHHHQYYKIHQQLFHHNNKNNNNNIKYSNNNLKHNLTKNKAASAINNKSNHQNIKINYNNHPLIRNYNKQIINLNYDEPPKKLQVDEDRISKLNLSNNNNNKNNNSSVAAEERVKELWMLRMKQKRARRLAHRIQLGLTLTKEEEEESMLLPGRNRRDSPKSQLQLQQQKPGIGTRRYCSARDPRTLAFEAPIVFEGKVKSMSSDRRTNFSVTFEIVTVHKKQTEYYLPQNVRLQFSYKNVSECDIYKETYRERGYVREELEQGKIYFLFVKQVDLGNFTILGQPIKKTKRTLRDVLSGVSEKYGKRATIEFISPNVTVLEGKRVRLVCKVKGQPPPKVTWYKDKRSINRNKLKYSLVHLKKRSELTILVATSSDAGEYECRAKNKFARQSVSNFTEVKILPKHSNFTKPPNKFKHSGSQCPPEGEWFCLNGGTCLFFEAVREPACTCPEGFSGNRCQTKHPTYQPTTPTKQQDCTNKYHGGYYC